jgi:ABC-type sugar transport system ATPase subunit
VLVGPSGCGKSTTLRMIAGLEELSSGTIQVGERVVNDVPPKDCDIAIVFQNYALYPHMTVYENMVFALKLRGLGEAAIKEKAMRAAKILGIERHPHSVAHVDAHAGIRVGETLPVFIDTDRAHFFAPGAVGERIATKGR